MSGEPNSSIARDIYSTELARLSDNPAAVKGHGSKIEITDLLRNTETWVVQVVAVEGNETWFLQRIHASGGERLVIPARVVAAAKRQSDSIRSLIRRRAARKALDTKRERGQQIGNPEALKRKRRG